MADYTLFVSKAPGIMQRLMTDFGFSATQAAGVLGNIGHECAGFRLLQEQNPVGGGRGGYGWCQWTGPRRRNFEAYAASNGLAVASDAANYGFLVTELRGSERGALRRLAATSGLVEAVRTFEQAFLRAGVKHYPSRERYGELAFAAFSRAHAGAQSEVAGAFSWESLLDEALRAGDTALSFDLDPAEDEEVETEGEVIAEIESPRISRSSTAEPVIYSTIDWGAVEPKRPITLLQHRPRGIVIHHTTDPNTEVVSLPHAFKIARSIQRFHMGPQRNWIDTGQHFTVSRGGHIMEGRHRSLEAVRGGARHVLGAHADTACNREYVGIENEGIYTAALPPPAQWDALVRLCAWIITRYGMTTDGIIGHRQCKSTECPGERFFGALPQLRRDVSRIL